MRSWTRPLMMTMAIGAALAAGTAFSQQPPPAGPPPGGGMGMHDMGMHGQGGMWGMHDGMMGGRGMDRILDKLNATPEQRDKIKAIFEKQRPAMQKLGEEMRTAREQFQAVEPGDPNYAKAVKQASHTAADLASRWVEEHAAMRSDVYAVLTPEQRAEIPKLREEMQQRWKDRARMRNKGAPNQPAGQPAGQPPAE
jgi:protein CpxP